MSSRGAGAGPHGARLAVYWAILGLATLGVCEAIVRLGLPPVGRFPGKPFEDPLLQEHPLRGYALRPGARSRHLSADFDVSMRVNERGLRDGPTEGALARDYRVLAVGDSYTMGLAVDEADRYTEQLEVLLEERLGAGRAAVVNAGVPGYSARQMRQTAEELLPEIRPRVLLAGLYASSYWRVDDPYLLLGGTLVSSHARAQVAVIDGELFGSAFAGERARALDLFLKRHFQLGARLLAGAGWAWTKLRGAPPALIGPEPAPAPPEEVARAYRPALDELRAMRDLAEGAGVEYVVLLINKQRPDGGFDDLERICNEIVVRFAREHGIRVVDPLPAFEAAAAGRPILRYPDNIHWTPRAHRLAAGLVLEQLPLENP